MPRNYYNNGGSYYNRGGGGYSKKSYYTESGSKIHNPEAYARTGAPMYKGYNSDKNINKETTIYKVNCNSGKKYIGKTTDFDRRMDQHFSGNGSKVTQKFKPKSAKEIDSCPGFFSKELEQPHTEKTIEKHGYDKVRGGSYVNSKTLKR
jgi:hypothetical protein